MITIALPMPPSVNRMYRVVYGPSRRVIKSERYKTWERAAHGYYLEQGAHRMPKIQGHFRAHITLDESKRGRSDADNRAKATLDALQTFGLIANDKYCDEVTIGWGRAPAGCIVTLSPVE